MCSHKAAEACEIGRSYYMIKAQKQRMSVIINMYVGFMLHILLNVPIQHNCVPQYVLTTLLYTTWWLHQACVMMSQPRNMNNVFQHVHPCAIPLFVVKIVHKHRSSNLRIESLAVTFCIEFEVRLIYAHSRKYVHLIDYGPLLYRLLTRFCIQLQQKNPEQFS